MWGLSHRALTRAPKPSGNSNPATQVFGKPAPWFHAAAPGDAQEDGRGTDLPGVFCHAPAMRGARALIGGYISITVLNGHWWLQLPFIWLNPF